MSDRCQCSNCNTSVVGDALFGPLSSYAAESREKKHKEKIRIYRETRKQRIASRGNKLALKLIKGGKGDKK